MNFAFQIFIFFWGTGGHRSIVLLSRKYTFSYPYNPLVLLFSLYISSDYLYSFFTVPCVPQREKIVESPRKEGIYWGTKRGTLDRFWGTLERPPQKNKFSKLRFQKIKIFWGTLWGTLNPTRASPTFFSNS